MSTPAKDTRPPRLCPYCLAGTPAEATTCWLCQSQLPAYEQRPTSDFGLTPRPAGAPAAGTPAVTASSKIEVDFVFWVLATVVASLLLVVIVIDVGYIGGLGYAALATVAVAPVLTALGAMVWLRRPGRAMQGSIESELTPTARVVGGVALTVTSVLAVVGLIVLLVLALLVLAFVACLFALGVPPGG